MVINNRRTMMLLCVACTCLLAWLLVRLPGSAYKNKSNGLGASGTLRSASSVGDEPRPLPYSRVAVESSNQSESIVQQTEYSQATQNWISVRAVGHSAQPIANASIYVARDQDKTPVIHGTTNADGFLALQGIQVGDLLVARAHSHGYAEHLAEEPLPITIVLQLRQEMILQGMVHDRNGSPVSNVRVVALPRNQNYPTAVDFNDPRCLSAVSSIDGRFEIPGTEANTLYNLVAAGAGFARWPPLGVECTDTPVRIPVVPIYGVVVRAVAPNGECPHVSDYLFRSGTPPYNLADLAFVHSVPAPNPIASLLGLEEFPHWRSQAIYGLLLFSDKDQGSEGPIPFSMNIPGYTPTLAQVYAERLIDSFVPVQDVVVLPTSITTGELAVSWSGFLIARAPQLGIVTLWNEYGQVQEFVIPDVVGDKTVTLSGIPAGEYGASFRMPDSFFYREEHSLVISENSACKWQIDGTMTGAIEIDIAQSKLGPKYLDDVYFTIIEGAPPSQGEERRMSTVHLRRRPHVLWGLPLGQHTVIIETPRVSFAAGGAMATVLVKEDGAARIEAFVDQP